MRTVYIDELFLLNFAADYIILHITAHFCVSSRRQLRLLAGAAVGAAYAVAVYFDAPLCASLPAKLAAAALVVLTAFGFVSGRLYAKRLAAFFAVSFLLGGLAYAASLALGGGAEGGVIAAPIILRAVILALALLLGATTLFPRGDAAQREAGSVRVQLTLGSRSAEFDALADSGNTLRDPLDGSPILVAEVDALSPLFDAATLALLRKCDAVDAVASLEQGRWRLISCRTAAGSAMLAAFRPDLSVVGGEDVRVLVAVSRTSLGAYPAIVGTHIYTHERKAKHENPAKVS